jgi:hypothetical protein
LFLTADHAGAENVNYLKDNKYNVKSVSPKSIRSNLKEFSTKTFGVDLVLNYSNFNLFFNKSIILLFICCYVIIKHYFINNIIYPIIT